ncbi:hypothetical protein ACOSP7_025258 [Xanthoceras sorbifolium]
MDKKRFLGDGEEPCQSLHKLLLELTHVVSWTRFMLICFYSHLPPSLSKLDTRPRIKITITATPSIREGCLVVRGKVVLTQVHNNIIVTPVIDGSAFIGATSATLNSRHVLSLWVLEGYRVMCLYRFKVWWMIPCFGDKGSDIPIETQLILLEAKEESTIQNYSGLATNNTFYVLLLPVLDGQFRASLQGKFVNELQLCLESGDPNVQTSQVLQAVFINSGDNPFKLIKNSMKYVFFI